MTQRIAIVTLTIGVRYAAHWQHVCRANWQQYAQRHGYDLFCLEQPLDHSERARRRSPAWQKCLILGQAFARRYERIVWIDADVLLNPLAPSIVDHVPLEQVGAVDEFACPTPELHRQNLRVLYQHWQERGIPFVHNETPQDYYAAYGLPPSFAHVVQTGVMVLSPRHHRAILEHTYYAYEQRPDGPWNYEMRPLSYELIKAGCVHWLDPRFNFCLDSYKSLYYPFLLAQPDHPRAAECRAQAMRDVYFLHFAGSTGEMARVDWRVMPPHSTPAAPWRLQSPVVLMIYARPDTTQQVFDQIRRARPPRLFVIADGPRADKSGDAARCDAARAIVEQVDWECELRTNFAEANLGLKQRIVSGLNWVFAQVEEAIILEDDCLPHPSFFRFCADLLAEYRSDERVLSISGNNFQFGRQTGQASYYFSRYAHIWGWATWRRAWQLYDPVLSGWPGLRDTAWLNDILGERDAVKYWTYIFQSAYEGHDSWDYALLFAAWLHGRLNILPNVNLVSNLGFRSDGTHNKQRSLFANLPVAEVAFPLQAPQHFARDEQADAFTESIMFSGNLKRLFAGIHARRQARRAAPAVP